MQKTKIINLPKKIKILYITLLYYRVYDLRLFIIKFSKVIRRRCHRRRYTNGRSNTTFFFPSGEYTKFVKIRHEGYYGEQKYMYGYIIL